MYACTDPTSNLPFTTKATKVEGGLRGRATKNTLLTYYHWTYSIMFDTKLTMMTAYLVMASLSIPERVAGETLRPPGGSAWNPLCEGRGEACKK